MLSCVVKCHSFSPVQGEYAETEPPYERCHAVRETALHVDPEDPSLTAMLNNREGCWLSYCCFAARPSSLDRIPTPLPLFFLLGQVRGGGGVVH